MENKATQQRNSHSILFRSFEHSHNTSWRLLNRISPLHSTLMNTRRRHHRETSESEGKLREVTVIRLTSQYSANCVASHQSGERKSVLAFVLWKQMAYCKRFSTFFSSNVCIPCNGDSWLIRHRLIRRIIIVHRISQIQVFNILNGSTVFRSSLTVIKKKLKTVT